ncbi:MAG: MATE family efflux transporter [Planctomycetota bacterium]
MPSLRQDLSTTLRLAAPVAVSQVGMLAMGLVDTLLVGRLGAIELSAVALGDALYFTFAVFAVGLIMSMDPLISQAYGAQDPERASHAYWLGRGLALALVPPVFLAILAIRPGLRLLTEIDPETITLCGDYVLARSLALVPSFLYMADRCFLRSLGDTRPAMTITLFAIGLNAALSYLLIFGVGPIPPLSVAGAALATAGCRLCMFVGLRLWTKRARYAAYRQIRRPTRRLIDQALWVGVPMGCSHASEVGAFAVASLIVGHVGVVALASHHVTMKMATASFMFAIAIGTGTGIRVGHAIGGGRPQLAARAAWVGLGLGACGMALSALGFVLGGPWIARAFTPDPKVVALSGSLLAIAGAFQLSDGLQAVAAGALRGAGQTGWPFVANVCAHWGVALPLAYVWALHWGGGARAVWWSLAIGLTGTAVVLLWRVSKLRGLAPPTPT